MCVGILFHFHFASTTFFHYSQTYRKLPGTRFPIVYSSNKSNRVGVIAKLRYVKNLEGTCIVRSDSAHVEQ